MALLRIGRCVMKNIPIAMGVTISYEDPYYRENIESHRKLILRANSVIFNIESGLKGVVPISISENENET